MEILRGRRVPRAEPPEPWPMLAGALNLLVFREDRHPVCGAELKCALVRDLEALQASSPQDNLIRALLRAGELECAVCDAASAHPGTHPVEPYMTITDRLAEALVARGFALDCERLRRILIGSGVPEEVEVAPAEGFAYYALDPRAFAAAVDKMPALPATVAVIGIRSIGTTLSAVTAAAARARGKKASRITVRPEGHPYNRRTRFSPEQLQFVHEHLAVGVAFLIVDEGPGLSGSSFLSVAEALVEAGVLRESILLLCGREPDIDSLCADDASQRAKEFKWVAVPSEPLKPAGAEISIGGGEWRNQVGLAKEGWPAAWISFERLKYLSPADGRQRELFKFAGLGHYGDRVLEREAKVAAAGFGPSAHREQEGFASYPWIQGRPMSTEDLRDDVLARLAAYCAFRSKACATELSSLNALEEMARHNLPELRLEIPVRLRLEHPVLADARMQPHEWLLTPHGQMFKTDSGSHGDDHFFPGVTDIAWDLAGAIVEWNMTPAQTEMFLATYRRASGDDVRERVTDFVTAYSVFRCAYCRMAANALKGTEEQARLERAAAGYAAARLSPYVHVS